GRGGLPGPPGSSRSDHGPRPTGLGRPGEQHAREAEAAADDEAGGPPVEARMLTATAPLELPGRAHDEPSERRAMRVNVTRRLRSSMSHFRATATSRAGRSYPSARRFAARPARSRPATLMSRYGSMRRGLTV